MMIRKNLCALSCLLLSLLPAYGKVVLVKNGTPQAAILLEKRPTRSAQLGAYELQHHIKLITGASLKIHQGEAPAGLSTVIRIGGENQNIKEEASVIKFRGNEILLTGGDTSDREKVDYNREGTFPSVKYTWKGPLFAVYDFLEDYCNVHFYGMDSLDTTYRKRATLAVIPKDSYFVSPMDGFRDCHDDDFFTGHLVRKTRRDQFLWKLRWRCSVTYGKTNHNTSSIYFTHWGKAKDQYLGKAFKNKRPKLFAQGYEGKAASCGPFLEQRYPGDADLPPQLCYSNPETEDFYVQEIKTYFNGANVLGGWENLHGKNPTNLPLLPRFPGKPYYYPYEGHDNGSFCQCAACRKLASTSCYSLPKYTFINNIAKKSGKLDPSHPGVSTLAYGETLAYPDGFEFAPNVSVELCLVNYSWWHPIAYRKNLENYKKWVNGLKGKGALTLWLYVYGPQHDAKVHYGNYKPFPMFYPWKISEQIKMFNKDGIKGIFSECKMGINFLETYLSMKLSYNPSLNADAVIDEFFNNYYGEAGPLLKRFYKDIENAVWNPSFTPKSWRRNPNIVYGENDKISSPWWTTNLWSREQNWRLGSPERLKRLNALLQQAQKKNLSPEERERLKRFIDIAWKPALQGRRDFEIYSIQKKIPPRTMTILPLKNSAAGNAMNVDWSKAPVSEKWLDCNGKDNGSTSSVQLAADDQFLYMKYYDGRKPWLDTGLWSENIEFFFSADKKYPLYHFAHGPKAKSHPTGLKYHVINDAMNQNNYEFHAVTQSFPTEKDWTLFIAIPKKNLPLENNCMNLDFFRMRHDGKNWNVSCWQPCYTVSGNKGMDSYGKLFILPFTVEEKEMKLLWPKEATKLVDDPQAGNRKAATLIAKYPWYLSYPFPRDFSKVKTTLKIRYRLEAPKGDFLPTDRITFGVYEWKTKKYICSKTILASQAFGKEYRDFTIGTGVFKEGMSFYVGSVQYKGKWSKDPAFVHHLDCLRFDKAE